MAGRKVCVSGFPKTVLIKELDFYFFCGGLSFIGANKFILYTKITLK
jgi:hypothetical protein